MRSKIILAALAILCVAAPASAEECNRPQKLIASLPMTDLGKDNVVTIPVSLNGIEKQFLFDTGGFFTQISAATADELKLKIRQGNIEIYATDGSVSRDEVFVPDFAIGPIHAKDYELPISPNKGFDGIFSPVAVKTIDFEMDFSTHKMNMFLNDHCDGKVIYWPFKTVGVVPFTVDTAKHMIVPVTINGHELKAIIDTGATLSVIRMNRAEFVFGLHPDSPDMTIVGHVGGDGNAPIFSYPFKTLTFGDVTVSNPHIHIYTDIVNKNADHSATTESLAKKVSDDITLPDVIIGMDVLRKLHLYLALKEGKLYFTEAGTPAAIPAAAPK
jgi:predicted aspartyl protease